MLGGDISNKSAPILAFNLDSLLFTEEVEKRPLGTKIKGFLAGINWADSDKKVDKNFVGQISELWVKHPFSIYLVTLSGDFEKLQKKLDEYSVPYTSLVCFDSLEEVRDRCNMEYLYYFDSNEENLSFMSCNNAKHIDELPNIV